jgi:hypothetical protein
MFSRQRQVDARTDRGSQPAGAGLGLPVRIRSMLWAAGAGLERRRVELLGAGHDRDRLLHRRGGSVDDACAAAQSLDVDAVGYLEDVWHIVTDKDHGHALAAQLVDQVEHLLRFVYT